MPLCPPAPSPTRRLMSCIERHDYVGVQQLIGTTAGSNGMEEAGSWANMLKMALDQSE